MIQPKYITEEHINWNGSTEPAIVLNKNEASTELFKWRYTDTITKPLIHGYIMEYANKNNIDEENALTIPKTEGWQEIVFNENIDVSNKTNFIKNKNGKIIVSLKETKELTDAIGLPVIKPKNGYQEISFQTPLTNNTSTNLELGKTEASQAFITIQLNKLNLTNSTPISNDIEEDKGIEVGSILSFKLNIIKDKTHGTDEDVSEIIKYTIKEQETWETLQKELVSIFSKYDIIFKINKKLDTITLLYNKIGNNKIEIKETKLKDIPLFSKGLIQAVNNNDASITIKSVNGVNTDIIEYSANLYINGTLTDVRIKSNELSDNTFKTVINVINTKLNNATFNIYEGKLLIKSNTTGLTSTISVVESDNIESNTNNTKYGLKSLPVADLFKSLGDACVLHESVTGTDYGTYNLTINNNNITVIPAIDNYTYDMLMTDLNKLDAVVSFNNNKIIIEPTSLEPIIITDTLFANIDDVDEFTIIEPELTNMSYWFKVKINNKEIDVLIDQHKCDTIENLINELNIQLTDIIYFSVKNNVIFATAIQDNNVPNSSIQFTQDNLFKFLEGFNHFGNKYIGVNNITEIFKLNLKLNQPLLNFLHGIYDVIPHKPIAFNGSNKIYFNHKSKTWKNFITDKDVE